MNTANLLFRATIETFNKNQETLVKETITLDGLDTQKAKERAEEVLGRKITAEFVVATPYYAYLEEIKAGGNELLIEITTEEVGE